MHLDQAERMEKGNIRSMQLIHLYFLLRFPQGLVYCDRQSIRWDKAENTDKKLGCYKGTCLLE